MVDFEKICKTCKKVYWFDPIKDAIWYHDGCSKGCSDNNFIKSGYGVVPEGIIMGDFIPMHLKLYG